MAKEYTDEEAARLDASIKAKKMNFSKMTQEELEFLSAAVGAFAKSMFENKSRDDLVEICGVLGVAYNAGDNDAQIRKMLGDAIDNPKDTKIFKKFLDNPNLLTDDDDDDDDDDDEEEGDEEEDEDVAEPKKT